MTRLLTKAERDRLAAMPPERPLPVAQKSGDFVKGFVPFDYIVDGLMQRKFLYALTAPTSSGKTAILLLIAYLLSRGISLGGREVEKGRVLYLAGENPDDIRTRWIKQCEENDVDPAEVDVVFLPETWNIGTNWEHMEKVVAEFGPFAMIIVDTSTAFNYGEEENSNVDAKAHAEMFRRMTNLPGDPTVLVACHPVKSPDMERLLPKGGGSFLDLIDTNLVALKNGDITELYWHAKVRGPDFAPIPFRLVAGTSNKLKDKRGRLITTVTAKPVTTTDAAQSKDKASAMAERLLSLMKHDPSLSMRKLAEQLGWLMADNEPNSPQVQRTMSLLKAKKLVEKKDGLWAVTPKGKKEAVPWGQEELIKKTIG